MGSMEENLATWEAIPSQALLNAKIHAQLECAICSEIMYVPYLASCGHSFCYECLNSWFATKLSCPTCRKELETPPVLNIPLRAISSAVVALLAQEGGDQYKNLTQNALDAEREHLRAVKGKRVFDKIFESTAMTLVDTSDGVPRCGNCHWEAHGSLCMHCGARFRIPRDDDYYDSEDGDAYNEDDEELMLERRGGRDDDNGHDNEANEYDTQDSFIDNDSDSQAGGNESDSSANGMEWNGFQNGDLASESGGERDIDTAIDNFNSGVIEIDSDGDAVDDDVEILDEFRNNIEDNVLQGFSIDRSSRGRRRQIINDSDSDE